MVPMSLEGRTLADCQHFDFVAPPGKIAAELKGKHWRVKVSGSLGDAIEGKLKGCVNDIALSTPLGPIIGAAEELQAAFKKIGTVRFAHTSVTLPHVVRVKVDPGLPVVRVRVDLVVDMTLGEVVCAPPFKRIDATTVKVGATLLLDELSVCTWSGDFGVFEQDFDTSDEVLAR